MLPESRFMVVINCLMNFCIKFKKPSLAWPLRRLYCPVNKSALVLEVGSGGNPYFRSNVCCDAYFETRERHYVPLVVDRPTVLAYVENLPFKDQAFDFVVASHVLEHSADPAKFLSEIQRVSKAGYIEVPDAFFERICPYPDHRLEITDKKGTLFITKKTAPLPDPYLTSLYVNKISPKYPGFIARNPFEHHVRYFWTKDTGGIKFKISNDEYKFDWNPDNATEIVPVPSIKAKIKTSILQFMRKCLSQHKRNKSISLVSLLRCHQCHSEKLSQQIQLIICQACGHEHKFVDKMLLKCN